MLIDPLFLAERGIYRTRPSLNGEPDFWQERPHEEIDARLIAEVDADSDLTKYTGFSAVELIFDANGEMPTNANYQMMFSGTKKLAAILYDDPSLSDVIIDWFCCSDPEDAASQWAKRNGKGTTYYAEQEIFKLLEESNEWLRNRK